ncbi:MAG: SUMF1/EgtB/PvdO family nonheme iron enzyme, partial [Candidatus Poribacteria bacterium]
NPTGPETGNRRVIRGGSWYNSEKIARCAFRMANSPDDRWYSLGFRCVQEFNLTRADEDYAKSNLFALDTRRLPSWDVNRDGIVDIQDLALVGENFGKSGIDIIGDVNLDGAVDIKDLAIVGHHLSEVTE